MATDKDTQSETSQAMTQYQTSIERMLLGEDSIQGTARLLGFVLVFILVFGTLFYFARG